MNKFSVIIPAAGVGKRFVNSALDSASSSAQASGQADNLSKIEIDLAGKPVFLWSVEKFARREDVLEVLLAVNPDTKDEFIKRWGDKLNSPKIKIIAGGKKERWQTVQKAIDNVNEKASHIGVHDAARPLISDALIDRIFSAAVSYNAALPGLPVADTLKKSTPAKNSPLKESYPKIIDTISRENLYQVQTPQVFEADLLRKAYEQIDSAIAKNITDDSGLIETLGEDVYVVESEATNFKITTAMDYQLAKALVSNGQYL